MISKAEAEEVVRSLRRRLETIGLKPAYGKASIEEFQVFCPLSTWRTAEHIHKLYAYFGPYFGKSSLWVGFGEAPARADVIVALHRQSGVKASLWDKWNPEWDRGDFNLSPAVRREMKSGNNVVLEDYSREKYWVWFGRYSLLNDMELRTSVEFVRKVVERVEREPGDRENELWGGPTEKYAVRRVRTKQDKFRRAVEESWGGKCAVTGLRLPVLKASHIVSWGLDKDPAVRTSADNGLLLHPLLDALFDKGYISFGLDGRIKFSADATPQLMKSCCLARTMRLTKRPSKRQAEFLRRHREWWRIAPF